MHACSELLIRYLGHWQKEDTKVLQDTLKVLQHARRTNSVFSECTVDAYGTHSEHSRVAVGVQVTYGQEVISYVHEPGRQRMDRRV